VKIDTGFLVGCDLGQVNDPTAVVIAQRWESREWYDRGGEFVSAAEAARLGSQRCDRYGYQTKILPSYDIVHTERVPLGTPYPEVEKILRDIMRRPELAVGRFDGTDGPIAGAHRQPPRLLVDATGVGAAVLDHLRAAGLEPVGILIHGGDAVTRGLRVIRVPKRDLVGIVSVRLQNRSLRFTNAGPYAGILQRELLNFRVKIDPVTSHDSYSHWREGEHDDLVLATAIALWWGDRQPRDTGASFGIIHASM
jgi:hypothetical protein